jgi:WD40 repeat protein
VPLNDAPPELSAEVSLSVPLLLRFMITLVSCGCLGGCLLKESPPAHTSSSGNPTLIHEMGHSDAVQFADFAHDGAVIVTVGSTEAIEWDAATGRELRRFQGHRGNVRAVTIHGEDVVTGSSDGTIKVWNLATGALKHDLRLRPRGGNRNSRSVSALAFADDSHTLVALDQDYGADPDRKQFLSRFDAETFQQVARFPLPRMSIDFATFSHDGRYLALVYEDKSLVIYGTTHGTALYTLNPPIWPKARPCTGRAVAFSSDSTHFVALSESNGALVYSTDSGDLISTISPDQVAGNVSAATFIDGSKEVIFSTDVDVTRSVFLHQPPPQKSTSVERLVRARVDSKNASIVASIDIGSTDLLFANGCCSHTGIVRTGAGTNVEFLAPLPSSHRLLVTMTDGNAYALEASTGSIAVTYGSRVSYVEDIALTSDLTWLTTAVSSNVSVWNIQTGHVESTLGPINDQSSRGSMIIDGPSLQMSFAPRSHVLTLGDSSGFYDIDLDTRFIERTARNTRLGYLDARSSDHALGLVDTRQDKEVSRNDFRRELALASGPAFDASDRRFRVKTGTFPTLPLLAPVPVLFGPTSGDFYYVHDQKACRLHVETLVEACFDENDRDHVRQVHSLYLNDSAAQLLVGSDLDEEFGRADTWSIASGRHIAEIRTDAPITALTSLDGGGIVSGNSNGQLSRWNTRGCVPHGLLPLGCRPAWTSTPHEGRITAVTVASNSQAVFSGGSDGLITISRPRDGATLLTIAATGSHWFVSAPDGRFDTDDLDSIEGLHWAVSDDPFHPLAPDAFFRTFFDPGLLSQVLGTGSPAPERSQISLQDLNRAAPNIDRPRVAARNPDGSVDIAVNVSKGSYKQQGGSGRHSNDQSDAYDLRLFRDGQLVDGIPHARSSTPDGLSKQELAKWREDMEVAARNDPGVVELPQGLVVTFKNVQFPRATDKDPVSTLTAYAFNSDRVRSTPVSATIERPRELRVLRAFIITIGIDDYGGQPWDLRYAARDARQVSVYLPDALSTHGYSIEQVRLISDGGQSLPNEESPTKNNVMNAIQRVVAKSTPNDLVIIYFSGHGYGGSQKGLNLLVGDSEPSRINWSNPSATDLEKTISAQDLLSALRGVSASELVLIVDACHAAAAIASGAWRPGPLGSPTFGQLAYDKGMEVLAASQTQQAALEVGGSISGGILTYALIHDGLRAHKALNADGAITIKSLMQYASRRVPEALQAIRNGSLDTYDVPVKRDAIPPPAISNLGRPGAIQLPEFFDFAKSSASVTLQ